MKNPIQTESPPANAITPDRANPALQKMAPELRTGIMDCIKHWKGREGNLIMILHEIQNRHGFVPREAGFLLSEQTGVPLARIYEVLTFYHYFRLVAQGKHNITVCNGTACYLKGAGRLLAELESRLGIKDNQTTEDRLLHLETVRCVGCCGLSPVVVVDKKTMGKVFPTDIAGIIEAIRKGEESNES